MARVLFLGDSAGTGFGEVTRNLGLHLIALGEDVRFVSLNEAPDGELEEPFVGRTAMIGATDGWLAGGWYNEAKDALEHETIMPRDTEDQLRRVVERMDGMFTGGLFPDGWTPDAAIILGDPASLELSPVLRLIPDGFPAFHYVPVEGTYLPPAWANLWRTVQPVAVCEFGAKAIAPLVRHDVPFIYHGVDTETFYPVSAAHPILMRLPTALRALRSKADCRKFLGLPQDEIILFRADRNMPRKRFAAMYRSVAPVLAKHPKTRLVVHARETDEGGSLVNEVSHFPPSIAARMNCTGIGGKADRKLLSVMYNAADIYVSTGAEGFGLTIAEALACGVPAIGLDYSSVPEVIGEAGVAVPAVPIDNIYSYFWATPIEPKYTEALDALVTDTARRQVLGMKGPYQVAKFNWRTSAEQFRDLIAAAVRQEVAA